MKQKLLPKKEEFITDEIADAASIELFQPLCLSALVAELLPK